MLKFVTPSIKERAFSCPYCGVLTTQYWIELYAKPIFNGSRVPFFPSKEYEEQVVLNKEMNTTKKRQLLELIEKINSGLVDIVPVNNNASCDCIVANLHLSECFNCKKFAVWLHDRLLFPAEKEAIAPNPDLPEDVIRDFEEAREILNASPRGAAALLRLSIQKLCVFLGEKGRNIDDDIANLVRKGLNPHLQKSLDIVRVIGNEAVHPGVIDLKDDRDSVAAMFQIVNSIADQMISHPKAINEMYERLPENKRLSIEKRNGKI